MERLREGTEEGFGKRDRVRERDRERAMRKNSYGRRGESGKETTKRKGKSFGEME